MIDSCSDHELSAIKFVSYPKTVRPSVHYIIELSSVFNSNVEIVTRFVWKILFLCEKPNQPTHSLTVIWKRIILQRNSALLRSFSSSRLNFSIEWCIIWENAWWCRQIEKNNIKNDPLTVKVAKTAIAEKQHSPQYPISVAWFQGNL